jgi:hypothetical protein
VHLFGFIIRIYHDSAQSHECQVFKRSLNIIVKPITKKISISEFTRGPLQNDLRAACCTSIFYTSFGLLANIQTGRKEIRKTERGKKSEKITYIIEGEIIQLNMKYGDIDFEYLTEVLLM